MAHRGARDDEKQSPPQGACSCNDWKQKTNLGGLWGNTFCSDDLGDSLGSCSVIYQGLQVLVLEQASILVSSPGYFRFLQAVTLN